MTNEASRDRAYRILIVDDSLVARNAMRQVVEKAGLASQLEIAVDGQHALRIIARMAMRGTPIEIVLLDIEMPVMDGITALPKIVEVEPAPRVIMTSALTKRGQRSASKHFHLAQVTMSASRPRKTACWARIPSRASRR
ncbi:MAG: response regulator [Geminicoccaceae bacterium]